MKQTSKILYMIGFIFNIIGLLIIAMFLIVFGVVYNDVSFIEKLAEEIARSASLVKQAIGLIIIVFSVDAVIEIGSLVLIILARRDLTKGEGKIIYHILLLIIGLIGFNLFYLLGGVFGLIAANDASLRDDE